MKGYRPDSKSKDDKKNKQKDPKSASGSKEIILNQVVLFTCGVKKNGQKKELRGSSKAPNAIDLMNRANYGCVATTAKANVDWLYQDCTHFFATLFPKAFVKQSSTSWFLVSKSYHTLEVVPIPKPTGADIVKFRNKDGSVYIVLAKSISPDIYQTWYKGPVHEPSSDVETFGSDSYSDGSSESEVHNSDYDPAKEDADIGHETGEAPEPLKCKRESHQDSDADKEDRGKKRTKLTVLPQFTANSSASTSKNQEPLFLPSPDSPTIWNSERRTSSARGTKRRSKKCTCRKITQPSRRVIAKIHGDEDKIDAILVYSYINPWEDSYLPPFC
ncbi:hypothetical protein MSAN_00447900 [Mycena sanguinolenta]|uniref:Uncharacterized protein n=1 Tax=Mycena sanguinolenta TaxID=230812 RepID=A0A8H6ZAZ2_9AGAR|nr:hypothetical protein MSAN_00447900 [Mycena sanguinolenta]